MSVVDLTSNLSHDMSSMNSNNTSDSHIDMDCCPDDCDCPSGVCFSLVYLLNEDTEINFSNISDRIDITNQVVSNQILSSIYRPPIFS